MSLGSSFHQSGARTGNSRVIISLIDSIFLIFYNFQSDYVVYFLLITLLIDILSEILPML